MCRYPGCKTCAASPECQPIHSDCYEIFGKSCSIGEADALDQLWTFTACKRPWRGVQPIYLSNRGVDMDMVTKIAPLGGLPQLCKLPGELLELIRGYSGSALFWRCSPALRLANLIRTDPEPLVTVPLTEIFSWDRSSGRDERLQIATFQPPIMRMTLDSDGIRKIESLSCIPQYSRECYGDFAFVVSRRSDVSGVMAHMKVRVAMPTTVDSSRSSLFSERPIASSIAS